MKKYLFLFLLAAAGTFTAQAQTSKDILDKLTAKAKTYKTIYAEFSSSLKDQKAGIDKTQSGTVKIKGQKYYLTLADYVVICDGVTVWNYSKDGNECTIDNLEDVKDSGFDPSEMFTIWQNDFHHEMKNTNAVVDGIACYEINLYPNNPKDKSFHTVTMMVDKAKMEVIRIVVKTRENAEITYRVKVFKANQEIPDTDFQFNKAKYPGVEMVDNRI